MSEHIVSHKTAYRILAAHREIEAATKLQADIASDTGRRHDDRLTPPDAFGRQHRNYEFGVPSGNNGHRLFGVSPALASYVIEAHIAAQRKELAEASVMARMELDGVAPADAA